MFWDINLIFFLNSNIDNLAFAGDFFDRKYNLKVICATYLDMKNFFCVCNVGEIFLTIGLW